MEVAYSHKTAVCPPNWYPSDDSIAVSGEAMANGEFSGGDLDGDTNHATDDPHFVGFMKAQTLYTKLDGLLGFEIMGAWVADLSSWRSRDNVKTKF